MVVESPVLERPALGIRAVAVGAYTEIVAIIAPSEASAGDLVSVEVRIRNLYSAPIYMACSGDYDNVAIAFSPEYLVANAGATYMFTASFTMPSRNIRVHIGSFYWTGTEWYQDDYGFVDIRLAVPVGWQLLHSMTVGIRPAVAPPVGWTLLASKTLTVRTTLPPVVGWTLLATKTLSVKVSAVPPPVGWTLLASKTLMVSPTAPPPVGWQLLDSTTVSITAGPISPKYELIQHVITPWAYFYEGDAEIASISFTLIKGTTWIAIDVANKVADELEARGSKLLVGEFYKDASALLQDRYLVKISYVVPTGVSGVGAIGYYIPPIVWTVIWYAAWAALIAFLVSQAVNWVKSMFYSPPPLSEDVKKQWSRETLTGAIIDLRPEYSPEELAGKTDQELRDILDEIYEVEVPRKGIPWWGWAILGGVGIAGGTLAYRFISPVLRKRKKEPEKKKE